MPNRIAHWLDGAPLKAGSGRRGEVTDPATGIVTDAVEPADASTVDLAVQAAHAAQGDWRQQSLSRRVQVLFRFRKLLSRTQG